MFGGVQKKHQFNIQGWIILDGCRWESAPHGDDCPKHTGPAASPGHIPTAPGGWRPAWPPKPAPAQLILIVAKSRLWIFKVLVHFLAKGHKNPDVKYYRLDGC